MRTSDIIGKIPIATTMVGAYPWPSWYTFRPFGRNLVQRLRYASYREAFIDANTVAIRDQERVGLDIVADPKLWYDELYGGWVAGVADRIKGIEWEPLPADWTAGTNPMYQDMGRLEGTFVVRDRVSDGGLEWARIYNVLSQLTNKPIKFGMIDAHSVARLTRNEFYKDRRELIMDLAKIYNRELRRLADAGCTIIQLEEPLGGAESPSNPKEEWPFLIEAFNKTVEGLRGRTSIWAHFCWAGAAGQARFYPYPKWDGIFPYVLEADIDVLNLEQASAGGADLHLLKEYPTDLEIAIGAISHRMIRVETPEEVASLAERVLRYVAPDRLLLTSDCGLGRQSLPRFQAYHKIKALADGASLARKRLK